MKSPYSLPLIVTNWACLSLFKSVHLSPSIMRWGTGVSVCPFVFSSVSKLCTSQALKDHLTHKESNHTLTIHFFFYFSQPNLNSTVVSLVCTVFRGHQRNLTLLGKAIYSPLYRRVRLLVPWPPQSENLFLHCASLAHSSSTSLPQLPEGAFISFSRPHLCHFCKRLEWGKTDTEMEGMMQEELKKKSVERRGTAEKGARFEEMTVANKHTPM